MVSWRMRHCPYVGDNRTLSGFHLVIGSTKASVQPMGRYNHQEKRLQSRALARRIPRSVRCTRGRPSHHDYLHQAGEDAGNAFVSPQIVKDYAENAQPTLTMDQDPSR